MKKLKLISVVVSVLFSVNFLFAVKPLKESKENLANILTDKLNKDVQLTNEQSLAIKEHFKSFITKMNSADSDVNDKSKSKTKELIALNYDNLVDSVLSNTQKEQKRINTNERKIKK